MDKRTELVADKRRAEAAYDIAMRGRMVPSPRAMRIKEEIKALQREIDRLDRAPVDEVLEIIAIPLLADVMNDLVAGVDAMLRRNGCQETVFAEYTRQIKRATMAMVDTLGNAEADMPKLLDVDDTLVDAVRKKLMSFIRQRLNITKQ